MTFFIRRETGYWNKKPTGAQELDFGHWAIDKLHDYWLLDSNNLCGLLTGKEYLIIGSTTVVENDRIRTVGPGDYIDMGTIPISTWTGASFLVSYENVTGGGANYRYFSVAKNQADDIRLFGIPSTPDAAMVDWDDGDFTRQTFTGQDEDKKSWVLSHTESQQYSYNNGRRAGGSADTLTTTGFDGTLRVGTASNTSYQIYASYLACAAFKEALSEDESLEISEAPYQLLKPRKSYWVMPSAPPGPTLALALVAA